MLRAGERGHIEPGVWHDWWNAGGVDAIVRVEITPGERLAHMIETLFGLAREGHVNKRGMPDPLQLALFATEFSDVAVFRKPPAAVQRVLFGALAPIARRRGYRATYPRHVENDVRPAGLATRGLPRTERAASDGTTLRRFRRSAEVALGSTRCR